MLKLVKFMSDSFLCVVNECTNIKSSYRFEDKVIEGVKDENNPLLRQHSLFLVSVHSTILHKPLSKIFSQLI